MQTSRIITCVRVKEKHHNDEVDNVEVDQDDLEMSQMEMGKYKCERIIWNPSMRNQFYYDENELYHDLSARLEMIKRTM